MEVEAGGPSEREDAKREKKKKHKKHKVQCIVSCHRSLPFRSGRFITAAVLPELHLIAAIMRCRQVKASLLAWPCKPVHT